MRAPMPTNALRSSVSALSCRAKSSPKSTSSKWPLRKVDATSSRVFRPSPRSFDAASRNSSTASRITLSCAGVASRRSEMTRATKPLRKPPPHPARAAAEAGPIPVVAAVVDIRRTRRRSRACSRSRGRATRDPSGRASRARSAPTARGASGGGGGSSAPPSETRRQTIDIQSSSSPRRFERPRRADEPISSVPRGGRPLFRPR